MTARFDDLVAGSALAFGPPQQVISASRPDEVRPALEAVDAATRGGEWAHGFVAYEAAAGLDPALTVATGDGTPLVWFAVTGPPLAVEPVTTGGGYRTPAWTFDRDTDGYRRDVDRVRAHIAAGETYQLNLTTRLRASFDGDQRGLYADLALRQRPAYAAYVDTGRHVVASASPELFFEWTGDTLLTRPMKGTAARGRTPAEDAAVRRALLSSAKERAENVIVVDLLRNDLGRIAVTGTVRAAPLGTAERYETVWQLTSDVAARVGPGTTLTDVFTALFPSGSVTGAPKPRTMQLIRQLEGRPRGVYCGAVGWVAPPGEPVRARFGVAIRTAVLDRDAGRVTYGVGAGITWGSDPDAELAELHAKARILDGPPPEFGLVETLRRDGDGLRNRDRHLDRLAASAAHFGFRFDRRAATATLDAAPEGRLRLVLHRDGRLDLHTAPLPAAVAAPVALVVDDEPVDLSGPWPWHKTTRREPYERRAARHGVDGVTRDVVLVNDRGEAVETTIANLAVLLDGVWCTPPLDAGCLPGVERARLLADGTLRERPVPVTELRRAEALAVVNSLRGWRAAELVSDPTARPPVVPTGSSG
ncbi:bifunctional chorismate-binding protein/class IV aminotransferase [Jatrophihabitans fulvus]